MVELGSVIAGRYRLVSRIGEGGMGTVYEGVSVRGKRRVAIKVMHSSIATDEEALLRFEREAQAATAIGSMHVVQVLDSGDLPQGGRFIVMEYLEGESLAARLKRDRALDPADAVLICSQMLDGLAMVHQAGIIHRDLKPANVFLSVGEGGKADFVKILDFGVCKIIQGRSREESLTGVGQLLGTPAYMSPEQIEHGPAMVDLRADVYSVGMILRRALAGVLPYKGKDVVSLVLELRAGKPTPLAEAAPHVDPILAAIVDRAIEWDPADRFRSALDFKGALDTWRTHGRRVDELLSDFLELKPTDDVTEKRPAALTQEMLQAMKRGDSLEDHSTTRRRASKKKDALVDRTVTMPGAPRVPEIPIDVEVEVEVDVELDDEVATLPLKSSRPNNKR